MNNSCVILPAIGIMLVTYVKTVLIFYFVCPANVLALWWVVGGQLVLDANMMCKKSRRVGSKPHEICQKEMEIVKEISTGLSSSILECQTQFEHRHWNCTADAMSVAKLLKLGTKETAYLYAISSAGVLYTVADACSKGRLQQCSCDNTIRPVKPGANFVWGGCTDDIGYAYTTSKNFVDVDPTKHGRDFQTKLQLHNNEAGRLATSNYMETACKCHGLSGTCSLKTCWRRMPSMFKVASRLMGRYAESVHVMVDNTDGSEMRPVAEKNFKSHGVEDLVFSQESPNYCKRNLKRGILGTKGRTCNPKSINVDGCDIKCCGRGYRSEQVTIVENCQCKLKWCCEVTCQTCQRTETVHRCK